MPKCWRVFWVMFNLCYVIQLLGRLLPSSRTPPVDIQSCGPGTVGALRAWPLFLRRHLQPVCPMSTESQGSGTFKIQRRLEELRAFRNRYKALSLSRRRKLNLQGDLSLVWLRSGTRVQGHRQQQIGNITPILYPYTYIP